MSNLPERIGGSTQPARSNARSNALARRAERNVERYAYRAWEQSQCDQIDSLALRDAAQYALQEECALYDQAMALAGDSVGKQRLAANKVGLTAAINDSRIQRRFS